MKFRRDLPWASIVLAGINIVVYVVMIFSEQLGGDLWTAWLSRGGVYPEAVVKYGEYYRLITAAFLHFDAGHLMNNMLMLVVLGERVEKAVGRVRFLILYLICAVGANVASVFWYLRRDPGTLSAGASGATMGLAGVLLAILLKRRRAQGGVDKNGMLIVIGMSIMCSAMLSNVNNMAHISGLLIGLVGGLILG